MRCCGGASEVRSVVEKRANTRERRLAALRAHRIPGMISWELALGIGVSSAAAPRFSWLDGLAGLLAWQHAALGVAVGANGPGLGSA